MYQNQNNVNENPKLNSPLVSALAAGFTYSLFRGAATLVILLATSASPTKTLRAEESTPEKIESHVDEAHKNTKKKYRKVKKKLRDATGNSSVKEDVKDAARNAGDEVEYQSERIKDKVD